MGLLKFYYSYFKLTDPRDIFNVIFHIFKISLLYVFKLSIFSKIDIKVKIKVIDNYVNFLVSNYSIGDIYLLLELIRQFETIKKLNDHKLNDLVDIGSYKGYSTYFLKKAFNIESKILAVEPNTTLHTSFKFNNSNKNIQIISNIIDKNSDMNFNVFVNVDNSAQYSVNKNLFTRHYSYESKSVTLRDLIIGNKIKKQSVIKISAPEINSLMLDKYILDYFDVIIIQDPFKSEELKNFLSKDFILSKSKLITYNIYTRKKK
jgi:FkbM family methyltransferase